MSRLFRVLRKPNHLDDYAEDDRKGLWWYLTNTRTQITILHRLGQIYVVTFCLAVCWSSVTLGLPVVYENAPDTLYRAQCLMMYICFCIVSNYLLIVFHAEKSHFGKRNSKQLPTSALPVSGKAMSDWSGEKSLNSADNEMINSDWMKCSNCDIEVPPRARHCAICQTCVLKKDHHCFFTGCCIGFYNQRYFITFCIFGIIGGTWGLYNLGTYLSAKYATFLSFQIYWYFLPVCFISCLFGYVTFFDACLVLLFYLHITSTATSYYYFAWQIYIISRGQTSYECVKRRKIYDDNFWTNMRSVFGPYWITGFLVPMPFLLNEGDGKTWRLHRKVV
ncbi:probable palmitoyltransferase ZDHHC24 [Mercenaria mercenaria]|uniref:probable palmitoyltransferase ZDHHC24 n=1 Tax=Mercenaria mercenaria TaxID=6596 RepID=UPI00234E8FB0|nr:probable palmitoyltransferase ZDHHC24 [Mercenaria mercenaria]XP_053382442.1 probable palmitoyltransferase ZDHHC24 [Mercenaria mercenaria]